MWFEGKGEPGDNEFIKEIRVGKNWLFGPYLEVVSESSVRQWYRSRRLRVRCFMRNPEPAYRIITEAMTKAPGTADDANK
jgi:hypothetical protein